MVDKKTMTESKIVTTTFQAIDEEGEVHEITCHQEYKGTTGRRSETVYARTPITNYFTSDGDRVNQIDDQTFEVLPTGQRLRKR